MASRDILKDMNSKLYEYFNTQAIENGYFDVCFKIGEKKLYAHKVILAAVSKPFDVMFADRWTTKDEPIELTQYSYDNYKDFLTFIYSGACELKDDNVLSLLDMSELYEIAGIKKNCEIHLSKDTFSSTNVFRYVDLSKKYSLIKLDQALKSYVSTNFCVLLRSYEFMNCNKLTVEAFVDYADDLDEAKNEYCFYRVLQWAKNRAMAKTNNQNFDLQKAIKNELSGILPRFKFSNMNHLFLMQDVVKQSYLFSGEELSKILMNSRKIIITVTNPEDQAITGKIPYDQKLLSSLSALNGLFSTRTVFSSNDCWGKKRKIPKCSSLLKKNRKIPFYLVIRNDGCVCLVPTSCLVDTDYLIAEMKSKFGFVISGKCKLDVSSNF